jgi:DNA polymerase III delta subunit
MAKANFSGISSWKLLSSIEKESLKSGGLFLMGENAYICSELEDAFKKNGFEIVKEELGTAGPTAEWESHASSMGLFADKKVIWSKITSNPAKWSQSAVYRYENLAKNLQSDSLVLVLQCTNKKLKVKTKELSLEEYNLSISELEKSHWLKRMAEKTGAPLNKASAEFLLSFDFDLLALSQYVNLWSLGGDFWAERALGWNPSKAKSLKSKPSSFNAQPAFQWVDSVIEGRRGDSLKLLKELKDEGQEIIQLFALLAKTLRLLSMLQNNDSLEGQAPFLVKKLQRQTIRIDISKAMNRWVEVDYAFKSSAQDHYALAERYITAITTS